MENMEDKGSNSIENKVYQLQGFSTTIDDYVIAVPDLRNRH